MINYQLVKFVLLFKKKQSKYSLFICIWLLNANSVHKNWPKIASRWGEILYDSHSFEQLTISQLLIEQRPKPEIAD